MAPSPPGPALGLYVHWPYCRRICPYCDFNVVRHRGRETEARALVAAILRDIAAHRARTGPRRLVSIFLGGGTPSLMRPEDVAEIIAAARGAWSPAADLEVSLEANPTDAEAEGFAALAGAGVNRLSLGVQSLSDEALVRLGRNHDAASARRAVARAQTAFARVSLDLIHSWPGQDEWAWRSDLEAALALGPEHISAYELTFEPGTAFTRARDRGRMVAPDEDRRARLFALTGEVLSGHGFQAYEISNFARSPATRARHNLIYWRGEDYVGVGPGAHGRLTLDGVRIATEAPRAIDAYVKAAGDEGPAGAWLALTAQEAALERLAMGLRLAEGVPLADLAALAVDPMRIAELGAFVDVQEGRLIVRPSARAVTDRLALELCPV
ncbi:MAG: radical SAM family heme chaperone HemW [Alphaproteobacteria bacterium]|nr:radical SAM family heme chaperone HemW [Alphaproteobacteria bacterium]